MLVAGVSALSGALTPAQAAPVARGLTFAAKVSAYDGVVVWTAFDRRRGGHGLWTLRDGKEVRVPVPVSNQPFDVDLGPGRGGAVRAVYSRCTKPAASVDNRYGGFSWSSSRGCRIYVADLRTGEERRIERTHADGASEYLPSIWRDRIAFARLRPGDRRPSIVTMRLDGTSSRTSAGGPEGAYSSARTRQPDLTPGPTSIDLRRDDVAFGWIFTPKRCPGIADANLLPDAPGVTEVRVADGAGSTLVAQACNGGQPTVSVLGPSWDGGRVLYAASSFAPTGARVMQSAPPFEAVEPAPYTAAPDALVSFATDARRGGYASTVWAGDRQKLIHVATEGR